MWCNLLLLAVHLDLLSGYLWVIMPQNDLSNDGYMYGTDFNKHGFPPIGKKWVSLVASWLWLQLYRITAHEPKSQRLARSFDPKSATKTKHNVYDLIHLKRPTGPYSDPESVHLRGFVHTDPDDWYNRFPLAPLVMPGRRLDCSCLGGDWEPSGTSSLCRLILIVSLRSSRWL